MAQPFEDRSAANVRMLAPGPAGQGRRRQRGPGWSVGSAPDPDHPAVPGFSVRAVPVRRDPG
ncbi:hypothetical protein FTX61_07705 [Nitriliruptoraceae bacterium ZYF776]|nr:hypothetical protein [Profundirhabdus halotolerans]